ncbi:MAG: hypothetical protein P8180_04590 [Gammaproteobacteria bacterium]
MQRPAEDSSAGLCRLRQQVPQPLAKGFQGLGNFDIHHLLSDPLVVFGTHGFGHSVPQVATHSEARLPVGERQLRIGIHPFIHKVDERIAVFTGPLGVDAVVVHDVGQTQSEGADIARPIGLVDLAVGQTVHQMHQKRQHFGNDVQPLGLGVGLVVFVLQIQYRVSGNAPGDKGQGAGHFFRRTFLTLNVPTALDAHDDFLPYAGAHGAAARRAVARLRGR